MKAINLLFVMLAAITLTLTSCKNDDDTPTVATCTDGIKNGNETGIDCGGACKACEATPTCTDGVQNGDETGVDCGGSCKACPTTELVTVGGSIGTATWTADKIYIIDRYAYVADGDVLTIKEGTIVKAKTGDGADASALIVAKGGKIMAKGTAEKPIIFTSVDDNIKVGETKSTLDPTKDAGKWGGLIILGKAPISAKPSKSVDGVGKIASIEGVPSQYTFSQYGGDDAADNSGVLEFASIRFTGTELSPNNEIQGLTLGGVGSGTMINNIEILSSKDDGIEIFGGAVNVNNLLVAYQEDDGIDLDQSYAGTIDNAMVLLYNPETGNDGFEIDGPEASGVNDGGMFTIKNTTVVQKGGANMARLKSKAQGTIMNSFFTGFEDGQHIFVDGNSTVKKFGTKIMIKDSEFSVALDKVMKGRNTKFVDDNKDGKDDETGKTKEEIDALNAIDNAFVKAEFAKVTSNKGGVTSGTKGADASKFGWTSSKKDLNLF